MSRIDPVYPCPRCRINYRTNEAAEACLERHEESDVRIAAERAKYHQVVSGYTVTIWNVKCRKCGGEFPIEAEMGCMGIEPPRCNEDHECPHCAETAQIYEDEDWVELQS